MFTCWVIFALQFDPRWNDNFDHCPLHTEDGMCKEDPECVWCADRVSPPSAGCVHRSQTKVSFKKRLIILKELTYMFPITRFTVIVA